MELQAASEYDTRISVFLALRTFRQYHGIEKGEYFITIGNHTRRVEHVYDLDRSKFLLDTTMDVDVTRVQKVYIKSVVVTVKDTPLGPLTTAKSK